MPPHYSPYMAHVAWVIVWFHKYNIYSTNTGPSAPLGCDPTMIVHMSLQIFPPLLVTLVPAGYQN